MNGLKFQLNWLRDLLEEVAERRLKPVLRRFNVPSRREVYNLSRRIERLERRLRSGWEQNAPAAPNGRGTTLDSLKRAELFWDEA